ncbi:MAG: UvrD-helicase domain-containing protein [Candidatus Edwardsbacteria bacterium]|jgi:ATP-dependent exoDNAse (exonuclease V) beta subunit|nr:UvrD-helicase domain-containing protein [Candidatus Edwardsbacteria bacterium]
MAAESHRTGTTFPHLLLIEASAGSGKTYALARRFVEFLLSARVPHNQLANLLAVTFTNNAAREMKERILERLKKLALGLDPGMLGETAGRLGLPAAAIAPLAAAQADAVIDRYADFQVQTIDSFTNRLAQASARELGFRPDFKVTTGYDELLDQAMALLCRRIGQDRDRALTAVIDQFLALVNTGSDAYVWDPRSRMRDRFRSFLDLEAKESGHFVFTDRTAAIARCQAEIRRVYDAIAAIAAREGFEMKRDNLPGYIREGDTAGILDRVPIDGSRSPMIKGRATAERTRIHDQSKRLWADLAPVMAELAAAWAAARVAGYQLPYGQFKEELERAKRRSGTHYIDDIAQRLAGSLRRQMVPEVYLKLGARLSHYLIDEFQDTDPAQWRSFQPLLDEALASDGSAFLVGDLKQAIYLFRKADYRIMKRLKEEIQGARPCVMLPPSVEDAAALENLPLNFRSGEVIVGYVEGVFQRNLTDLIRQGRFRKDRTDLTRYRQRPERRNLGRGFVSVRHFERPRDDEHAPEEGAPERAAVLSIIREVTGRGYGYHDIAILASTNDRLEAAIGWLTGAGIPASSSSGLDVRKRRVVAELLELLRWLDSPIDNLAWAAVVRGEMLARAARADGIAWDRDRATGLLVEAGQRLAGRGAYYNVRPSDGSFDPVWERYFRDLYRLVGFSPVYDIVCLAVARFDVFRQFPDEAAAVLLLLQAVNGMEAGGVTSIRDFLEECGKPKVDSLELELPEHMLGVRLMTSYKAKGMGFPVVINLLADDGRKRADDHHSKDGDEITIYRLTDAVAEHTRGFAPDLAVLKDELDADAEVQELNSLYVACTRAQDELYNLVSYKGPGKSGKRSAYSLLFPAGQLGERATPRAGEQQRPLPPLQPDAVPGRELPCEWRPQGAWTLARLAEIRRGQFFHRVLEGIAELPEDPGPLVAELVEANHGMVPDADPAVLVREVKAYLARPQVACWFEGRNGRTVRREVEFIDRDGHTVRMDRLVRDGDELTVIDFKTGSETPAAGTFHRRQVRQYIEVLTEAHATTAVSGRIIYWDGTVSEVRP